MPSCHYCGSQLEARKPVRTDVCPSCGRGVKVCLNCAFYDEGAEDKCREPQAEWVKEKDRSNFCDYFRFLEGSRKSSARPPGASGLSREKSARQKLDELFGKGK